MHSPHLRTGKLQNFKFLCLGLDTLYAAKALTHTTITPTNRNLPMFRPLWTWGSKTGRQIITVIKLTEKQGAVLQTLLNTAKLALC